MDFELPVPYQKELHMTMFKFVEMILNSLIW